MLETLSLNVIHACVKKNLPIGDPYENVLRWFYITDAVFYTHRLYFLSAKLCFSCNLTVWTHTEPKDF